MFIFAGIRKKDDKTHLYFSFEYYTDGKVKEIYAEPTLESVGRFFSSLKLVGQTSYMVSSDLHHPDEFPEIPKEVFEALAP